MRVRILRPAWVQDAGVDRALAVGESHDFPAVVAHSLIAEGMAIEDKSVDPPAEVKVGVSAAGRGRKR